jgi:hypothetical protein
MAGAAATVFTYTKRRTALSPTDHQKFAERLRQALSAQEKADLA